MCGINGFTWEEPKLIEKMNDVTHHRGPDDLGTYCQDGISLGHTRLSIIDLSDQGHQPMSNEDQTIWITYNGEIYNYQSIRTDLIDMGHQFKSNTDTEVVIHAYEEYGLDFVKFFNGMWSFCIFDKINNTLILSRDQFGIKPLYYYMDSESFIFSSMISAILLHNIKTAPNEHAIMEYLAHNLEDHDNYTFFVDIHKIPQDSLFIYHLKTKEHTTHRWYHHKNRKDVDAKIIRELFIESVRLRTISDVPIGSCLSGGIDSSAIVCTLNSILLSPFKTYSLISPGFSLDESEYVKEIGKVTNTNQFFTQITELDFLNDLVDFICAQEEPVTGMSPYAQYCVMKLAHQNQATVLLDGQGGDEIFAGYIYYFTYYFYELLKEWKILTLCKEILHYIANWKNIYPIKMLTFCMLPERLKYPIFKKMGPSWINYDLLEHTGNRCYDPRWRRMTLQEGLTLTLYSTAIPHLLRWEDKNSMRWSIESRPPFLDVNLVEAALSLPSEAKLSNGKTKIIFKEALYDILPRIIRERKDKIGFAAPVDEFFRKPAIIEYCSNIIYSEEFKSRHYWQWDEVENLYSQYLRGEINIGDTIWKWINLNTWLNHFFDQKENKMD